MSKTMFDDDLHTGETGDTGGSVIPAAAERHDREPVVVRRQAALSALIGLGASMLSGLYLWRAVDQGGVPNWAIGAVLAGLALFHITQWIDGRTPLLVADDTGIRLRLGNVWHGLLWQDVSRISVHERQGMLRDGRVVVHPADETALEDLSPRSRRRLATNSRMYGAPFAIPLGVTTVTSTDDLAGALAEFAGDATVVELAERTDQASRDFDTEPDTVPDTDARTEAFTWPGVETGPETEPYGDEPETEDYDQRETSYVEGDDEEPDTAPDTEVYSERMVETDTDAATDAVTDAATEPDTEAYGRETEPGLRFEDRPDDRSGSGRDDEYDADWFFDDETDTESGPEPGPGTEPQPGAEPEPSAEPEPAPEPEPSPGPRPEPQWRRRWREQRAARASKPAEAPEPSEPDEPDEPLKPVQPARPLRRAVRADVTRRPTVRAPILGQLALQEPLPAQPTSRTDADRGEGARDDRRSDGPDRPDRPRGPRPRGNMSLVLGETPPPLPPEPEPEPEPMPVPEETAPDPADNPVIGPVIAEARRLLGLSVDELATRTRIRPHVIEAIEVDDFGPCAGDFYARGHLRALSRVLGVDPAPLVQHFDERYASAPINARRVFEAELAAGASGPFRGVGNQGGPRWGALVIAVLVLVLVWILVTILGAGSSGTSSHADLNSGAAQIHRTYDGPQAGKAA